MNEKVGENTRSSKKACGSTESIIAFFFVALAMGLLVIMWVPYCDCKTNTFTTVVPRSSSNVTIHYIDVGQGDSIFIDSSGFDVLIDGGPADAGQTVLDYLGSLSVTRIDLMIATHPHEDHVGGLVTVLNSAIDVNQTLIDNQNYSSTTYTTFLTLAQNHNLTAAHRGQTLQLTDIANLTVFNPVQPIEFDDSHVNDNSIVVKLQVSNTSFLFTGDASADAEQSMFNAGLQLRSDILKIGHHGSRYSTTQSFLDAVAPSYAIISAGIGNSYGHPHQETIDRLVAENVTTYGTHVSGTIIATTDGSSIAFYDAPQPITPEFTSNVILVVLMMTTFLAVIVHRRKCLIRSE